MKERERQTMNEQKTALEFFNSLTRGDLFEYKWGGAERNVCVFIEMVSIVEEGTWAGGVRVNQQNIGRAVENIAIYLDSDMLQRI